MSEIGKIEANQTSPRILDNVVNLLSDSMIVLDSDFRVVFVNRAAERLIGMQSEEIAGRVFFSGELPMFKEGNFERECRRAVEEQEPRSFEAYMSRGDTWLEYQLFPTAADLLIQIRDITPQKRYEIALSDKEIWYSTLVNSICGIVWTADLETFQFTFVSKQAEKILGYPVEQWLKEPDFWRNHLHPDDAGRCVKLCYDASMQGRDHEMEYRMIAADGRVVWLRDVVSVRREDGVERIRGIMLDITRQKEADERLLRKEAHFRMLVEDAWDSFAVVAKDSTVLYVSPSIERMLGYKAEEYLGMRGVKWVHPADMDRLRLFLSEIFSSEKAGSNVEYRSQHKNGSWHAIEATGKRFVDEHGRTVAIINIRDITDRSRVEQQLRESENRFRLVFEKNASGMAVIDIDFQFLQVNAAFCRMLGYTEHELLGKTVCDITYPDDWPNTVDAFAEVKEGRKRVVEVEKRCLKKNGNIVWTHSSAVFLSSEGKPAYCIATIQNITERKVASEALRISEERYRSLTLASSQIVWITNANGEATPGQPTWSAFTGQAEEEILGWGWLNAVHPDDRERVKRVWTRAIENKTYYQCEIRIRSARGEYREFAVRGVSVLNSDGKVREWVGTCTDITDQKKAAADILKWKNRYEAAIEASGHVLYDWDIATDKVTYGGNLQDVLGYSHAEITGGLEGWSELIHPEDRNAFIDACNRVQKTHQPFHLQYRVKCKSGKYIIVHDEGRFYRFPNGEIDCMIGFVSDITEQKNTLSQLANAKAAAEAASRAKDDFLAALSHELRTPLNPVLMLTSELENSTDLPASARQDFAMIRKNIELEARIIDDLLDLTRIMRGKVRLRPHAADAHILVRQAIDVVRGDIDAKHLNLKLDLTAQDQRIYGDAVRLQQVFWNIIKNGVKFTPLGGTICIRSRNTPDQKILLEFSDTGMGIAHEDLGHIFDAFVQGGASSHQFGGLGLGLTISRSIIELHHGRIWAESEGRGCGSSFYVEIPLMVGANAREEPQVPENEKLDTNGAGTRILLVEDHEPTRLTLERLLTRRGYQVSSADSVASARDLAAHRHFDIVTSDIGLPDGSGHELMSELHDRYGLTGIALSGYGMEEDIQRSLASGFATHLTKPVDMESLQRAIRDVEKPNHSKR